MATEPWEHHDVSFFGVVLRLSLLRPWVVIFHIGASDDARTCHFDHGKCFGEQWESLHGSWLYEWLVQVRMCLVIIGNH